MNGSLRVNRGWVVFWCSSRETGGYGGARSEGEVPPVSWGGLGAALHPPGLQGRQQPVSCTHRGSGIHGGRGWVCGERDAGQS